MTQYYDNSPHDLTYSTIFDQSPISTQIFSLDGSTIKVNKAWEKLWGVSLEKIKGYNILQDKQLIEKGVMDIIKGAFSGKTGSIPALKYIPEKTIKNATGIPYRWTKGVIYPIKDRDGRIREVVLQHEDITSQIEIQEKVNKSEIRFRSLIESRSDAVALVGKDGIFTYVSPTVKNILGYTPAELLGTKAVDLFPKEFLPEVMTKFHNVSKTHGLTETIEHMYVHKNGSIRWLESTITNLIDDSNLNSYVSNFKDITEKKQSEERKTFLYNISLALTKSFDQELTLREIAQLIVSYLADFCRIALINDKGEIRELAVNSADPSKITLVNNLYTNYKDLPLATHGLAKILHSGKPEMISIIDKNVLKRFKTNTSLIKVIKKIELKSYMGVPLIARNRVIGAITFSSTKSHRYYSKEDLSFVEDVAYRIALALDNAKLYQDSEREKQRLSLAQKVGGIGTFEWDSVRNTSSWTQEFEALYGYSQQNFKAKNFNEWTRLIHPEDREKVLKASSKGLKKGKEFNVEFRVIWPDESIHYLSTRAQIFRDKKGKPLKMVGVNIDITEQQHIENDILFLAEASKTLASSLDYNKTLQNVAKLAILRIADWCTVDILNEKEEIELIAVAHKEPGKIKWAKELRKNNPPDINSNSGIPLVLKTGKSQFYPQITDQMLVQNAKDEKALNLSRSLGMTSVIMAPLCVNNKPLGVITFITTSMKRHYTKADLAIAEELASRAGLAIENSKLYSEAKKAVSIRDEFISVASHELKTPITSLKMYSQVLKQQFKKREMVTLNEYVKKMDNQVDKLTILIEDLLNVTKLEHGKLEFVMEEFNIQELIKEAIDSLHIFDQKFIVKGQIKKKVYGDKYRIYQVLTNLLTNAIKYSPQKTDVIVLLQQNKNKAVITVQDFGIGIDPIHLDKLFNRFYRVADSAEKTYPGLGMGLYIANEIIKRHNGEMRATSIKGQGSKFSFTLPFKRA